MLSMAHKWRTKPDFEHKKKPPAMPANGFITWSARRELNPQPSESEV